MGNLNILFRGLVALVPSSVKSGKGYPSSVTLLFPEARGRDSVEDELKAKRKGKLECHPHKPNNKINFNRHSLSISEGILEKILEGKLERTLFRRTDTPNFIESETEIKFYDGSINDTNAINSPGLGKNEDIRKNDDHAIKLTLSESANIINLQDIYSVEQQNRDKRLEVDNDYLEKDPKVSRVFRLHSGDLSVFEGYIDTTEDSNSTVSGNGVTYIFDEHDQTDTGQIRKTKVSDTVIFTKRLQGDQVTVILNDEELTFLRKKGYEDICLLIENLPGAGSRLTIDKDENNEDRDYDFALIYRAAYLNKDDNNKKFKRIPKVSGGINFLSQKPVICAMASYSDHNEA